MRVKYLVFLTIMIMLLGCNRNQPVIDTHSKNRVETTISYQDIIKKINAINTKNKDNKRLKKIVKSYSYRVSDDDSKNSARKKALAQLKKEILEEIGVYVESYLEINKIVSNKHQQNIIKQEIKNLTAGIIKTKILDEKFDGKTYYVKVSTLVDPDSVSEGISELLKIRANRQEIDKLSQLLKEKKNDLDMRSKAIIKLQKKIANQELLNMATQKELKGIHQKLKLSKAKLLTLEKEKERLTKKLNGYKLKEDEIKKLKLQLSTIKTKLKNYNYIKSKLTKLIKTNRQKQRQLSTIKTKLKHYNYIKSKLTKLIKTNRQKQRQLSLLKNKLQKAQHLLSRYQVEENRIRSKIDKIKHIIEAKTNSALKNIERGMTENEAIEVAGEPRVIIRDFNGYLLNYGKVIVHIENGIVACITNADCKQNNYRCTDYTASSDWTWSPQCILK